jgi:hypothetical protein
MLDQCVAKDYALSVARSTSETEQFAAETYDDFRRALPKFQGPSGAARQHQTILAPEDNENKLFHRSPSAPGTR